MIQIAIVNTKGGAGKTTLAANLGALLADLGVSVLLVDADVQPALSSYFPLEHEAEHGLSKLIQSGVLTEDLISSTIYDNLDIVRSDGGADKLAAWIQEQPFRWVSLRNALSNIDPTMYQCVIIDTQGAAGPLADAAVLAATRLLAPLTPETPTVREFERGTLSMVERLSPMRNMGVALGQMQVVIYKQDRTRDAQKIAERVRARWLETSGQVAMLNTVIPAAKSYKEAATAQVPVHLHEPSRNGTMPAAGEVMHQLVWEMFPNLDGRKADGGDL